MEPSPLNTHFIISAPRSGSTWLAKAINGHPDIFATENRLFGEFCEIWPNSDGTMMPRITFDEFLKQFSSYFMFQELGLNRRQFREKFQMAFNRFLIGFCRRNSGKELLVDKVTPYLGTTGMVVEKIQKYFPEARIIQLIRDGRDVVTSGTFDWILKDAQGTDRYSFFVEQRPGLEMKRFFDDNVLARWAKLWMEPIKVLEDSSFDFNIQYESMIKNHASVLGRVFEFLGCRSDDDTIQECISRATFEKMSGRKQGQQQPLAKARKGIAGDWKNYFTRKDGELFHEIAGETLIELGYVTDRSWIKSLPDELHYVCD